MTRMQDPDNFEFVEPTIKEKRGRDPNETLAMRRATMRAGFLKLGIGVDEPPRGGEVVIEERATRIKWTWQAIGTWRQGHDMQGVFNGSLARCDQHPRLERVRRAYNGGSMLEVYFVNGEPMSTLAEAMLELARAEEKGLWPAADQTFMTFVPKVIEGTAFEPASGEDQSYEGMRR